jgi:CobW/HypB/UreG, nucleotide-binding domain
VDGDLNSVESSPVPVTLVTGFLGAGKSTLIEHWLSRKPAAERWAVLVNDAGDQATPGPPPGTDFFEIAGGCACCAALPVLRSRLPGVLRAGPWQRLLVELSGTGHPGSFIDVLRSAPFKQRLRVDGVVCVVDATRAQPYLAELPGEQPANTGPPPALFWGRELARAQLEAAERVWVNRADRIAPPLLAQLVDRLAGWPPFGRDVGISLSAVSGDFAWRPAGDPFGEPVSGATPGSEFAIGGGGRRRETRGPGRLAVNWCWPAAVIFDRRKLQAALQGMSRAPSLAQGAGAFATERDWYRWQWSASAATPTWEASAYRRNNRLELVFSLTVRPGDPAAEQIQAIEQTLLAALVVPGAGR